MSNGLLSRFIPGLLSVLGLLAVLAALSWRLFLVAFLVVPVTWVLTLLVRKSMQLRIEQFRREFENFSSAALAILQRRDLARIHGAERNEIAALVDHSRSHREAGRQVAWISTANGIAQGEAALITGILVLLAGAALIASGELTFGMLIAFYFALNMLRSNLSVLLAQYPSIVSGNNALEELFKLLQNRGLETYTGSRQLAFRGEVELEKVTFGYSGPLLADASMTIPRGRLTILAGPSGSGKTTVANLVLGLIRPDRGRLLADGEPYQGLDISTVRARIGYAVQDPTIFVGTVRENLLFGAATDEKMIDEALEIAGATALVAGLPNRLDTRVGEKGARLSGGQRQRLSIARAVLRCPALLILDEPTNHLGAAEAIGILRRFRAAYPESAILVITHDNDVSDTAEKLYLIKGGTIRESAPTKSLAQSYAGLPAWQGS